MKAKKNTSFLSVMYKKKLVFHFFCNLFYYLLESVDKGVFIPCTM